MSDQRTRIKFDVRAHPEVRRTGAGVLIIVRDARIVLTDAAAVKLANALIDAIEAGTDA
ncbi:hypothetical protein [Skermania sp. ID1734]|uniref:hypothetical protein n=1 Tax=Skermania sp. ID1734 TaxID=2597516 RepID=UPI00163D90C5|nr:hypothetical protein [Skermania sp. ID1734]